MNDKIKNEIMPAIFNFIVSLSVAIIVTDNQNIIYDLLSYLGIKNDLLKKTILTLLITLLMTIGKIVIKHYMEKFLIKLQPMEFSLNLFEKFKEEGNASRSNRINKLIEFDLNSRTSEYSDKEIKIILSFQPKNRLYLHFLKYLGLTLEVYFQPDVLDVQLVGWEDEESSFSISSRRIGIEVFKQAIIKGKNFTNKPYKIQESITIKPIRVKEDETNLDFYFSTQKCKILSNFFTKRINLETSYIVIINE